MTVESFLKDYWRYYLVLEERFTNSLKYVELSKENYSTYSIEYVNQLQAIGSELDVVMKAMSGYGASEKKTISAYVNPILNNYPDIKSWEVKAADISIKPFARWDVSRPGKSLTWWKAYNAIKHGRNGNYKKGNFKNTVHALMGLYLLEMMWYKKLTAIENKPDILIDDSRLFTIIGWNKTYFSLKNAIAKLENNTNLTIVTVD